MQVFDFDEPANNYFLVVRELWVQGDIYRRRLDLTRIMMTTPSH